MSSPETSPCNVSQDDATSVSSADDSSISSTDEPTAIHRFAEAIRILANRPPPSPSSSLKACFVRSRPTSADHSEYDSSSTGEGSEELRGPGPSSFVAAWMAAEATETWTRSQIRARAASQGDDSARSVFAASMFTACSHNTIVPMRIVRRTDPEPDREAVDTDNGTTSSIRRRTWPSVKRIRKTMSSILNRKAKVFAIDDESATASSSLKQRRVTVSGPARSMRPVMHRAFSSCSRSVTKDRVQPATKMRMRRSRSFAGFTSALGAIDDVENDDLDDVAAEARGVVEGIRSRWVFEEVAEGQNCSVAWEGMSVFERDVE